MNNLAITHWLDINPEWVLGAVLKENLDNQEKYRKILDKTEHGYLTKEGEYYPTLRKVPSFVGIRHVIKAKKFIDPMN